MADAELEPLYLICGSDRGKVLRAAARLRARVLADGGAVEDLDAAEADGRSVAATCEQLGLLAGPRLIVVQGVEAWRAEDVQAVQAYAGAPVPATVLAFVAGSGLRKDHRVRSLPSTAQLLAFDLPDDRALPEHLRKEARRLGADIAPDALRRLIELCGTDAVTLESELDKLATHAAGEPIDVAAVELLAFRGGDVSPFALTDAVSARDRRAVFVALDRALAAGEKPHALLPQIARHVDLLRRARRASDRGLDHRGFAREAGVHEFRARKVFEAVDRWPEADAARAVVELAVADHAMKGGERIDPAMALQRALASAVPSRAP